MCVLLRCIHKAYVAEVRAATKDVNFVQEPQLLTDAMLTPTPRVKACVPCDIGHMTPLNVPATNDKSLLIIAQGLRVHADEATTYSVTSCLSA